MRVLMAVVVVIMIFVQFPGIPAEVEAGFIRDLVPISLDSIPILNQLPQFLIEGHLDGQNFIITEPF